MVSSPGAGLDPLGGMEQHDPLADPPNPVSAWNLANALTVFRMLLVPVFLVFLFHGDGTHPGWRIAATVAFAVASVTDRLDGELARKRGSITEFGKLADPLADKALIGAALVGLSVMNQLPWWVTVVILVREVLVTVLRFWVIRHGVLAASRGGKLKTLLQALAIGLFLLPPWSAMRDAAWTVMIAAIVVGTATGIDYVGRALSLRRRGGSRVPPGTSVAATPPTQGRA